MRKKLIEVALPLEAINEESSRRKRKAPAGYPTTLHKWWAQRPLAACRAVLFAQLVDDPSSHPDKFPTEEAQEAERERLFEIIRNLVKWENSNNEHVLNAARAEILRSTGGNPPPVFDPFCGGGSIPLEAQRLGLEVYASDLNPVAVLITNALIGIPSKFSGLPPVHPTKNKKLLAQEWRKAQGLAEDVRYYGQWVRDEAEKRIGHLYPRVKLPKQYGGGEAPVVAWLWARAVNCPNPVCGGVVPLVRSFWLSTKKGKASWLEPEVDPDNKTITFRVKTGTPDDANSRRIGLGTTYLNSKGAKVKATFKCIICEPGIVKGEYADEEADNRRVRVVPLAIVAEYSEGRIYLPFDQEQVIWGIQQPERLMGDPGIQKWLPTQPARGTFASNAQGRNYGFKTFADYYTPRQLIALATLSEIINEARDQVLKDAQTSGMINDVGLAEGGRGAAAYADAVVTYLAFAISRAADYNSSIATWRPKDNAMRSTLSKQAIQMVWDFAEGNPFVSSSAGFLDCCKVVARCIEFLPSDRAGTVFQHDAHSLTIRPDTAAFCTDPPYYSNVSYADLADYFYVWLRRSLHKVFPDILTTLLTPKSEELVADPYRFEGDEARAQMFFQEGLERVFSHMARHQDVSYPITIFYAFKQTESDDETDDDNTTIVTSSTGWETMLEGLIRSGFAVTGTWPMRTEGDNRQVGLGANALASSIVLVCRPRHKSASLASRREFINALKREMPDALKKLQHGNVAPVDLAQASIGPGMAIFSRYAKVLEADGQPMPVRTALQIINQELDAYLTAQEGELDQGTRFCLAWFEQYGMGEGKFGDADVLARAKNTAVQGLVEAGVIHSKANKVRLLKRAEYPEHWDPNSDYRVTVWECTQQLIQRLYADNGGIEAAARLVNQLGSRSEDARALAYRLYSICERKKWADEALAYNTLVVEWPAIQEKAAQIRVMPTEQANLFG